MADANESYFASMCVFFWLIRNLSLRYPRPYGHSRERRSNSGPRRLAQEAPYLADAMESLCGQLQKRGALIAIGRFMQLHAQGNPGLDTYCVQCPR